MPLVLPEPGCSLEQRMAEVKAAGDAIKAVAERKGTIVVNGPGAVGLELAGDIKVTIIFKAHDTGPSRHRIPHHHPTDTPPQHPTYQPPRRPITPLTPLIHRPTLQSKHQGARVVVLSRSGNVLTTHSPEWQAKVKDRLDVMNIEVSA